MGKFDPSHLRDDEVYLDEKTGDFYEAKNQEWNLAGNVGLHWVNALGTQAD
jgi:hypothetical protein